MDQDKSEPFDIYSDAFSISVTPWGANMSFALREAHPSKTKPELPKHQGTVRMSNEQLKIIAFMIARQIKNYEHAENMQHHVPAAILNQLGVGPEDWESFWSKES